MKLVVALFFIMLFMHQDFWWWEDDSLVLGFMPIGLAFHALFSVLCAVLGAIAILTIWPKELDEAEAAQAPKKEGDA
ncbi:MAG: DUF3311 domain-containing protein [Verrucomicrobiota bacterium]